jgi:curved DNA-binding protein CbpA
VSSESGRGDASLSGWIEVLDELSYYEIFGIDRTATADEVRDAFHRFSDAFHPDRHVARSVEERERLSTVFKRGTEACMVLSDEVLRARYDAQLAATGPNALKAPQRLSGGLSRPPAAHSMGPPKLEDAVRSPTARPFARRAEELVLAGDLRQAKLQLVMANHMDPGNEALESALQEVEAKLKG